MPDQERLQVYLAKCGIASRRKCEEIIAQGRISVNGKVVIKPGTKVSSEDTVYYDGKKIGKAKQNIYLALHKPTKYLCSNADPDDRPLAINLLTPVFKQRLFNVGRLDYLTSGLIFFTNDGDFAKKITHPSTHIEKEYEVITKDEIPVDLMEEFKSGIYVQGEFFKMKDFEFKGPRCVHIILEEGKNRELRKVFLSRNISVKKVHRLRIGCVTLKGIHSGHFRKLTEKEVSLLLKDAESKAEDRPGLIRKKGTGHLKTLERSKNLKLDNNQKSITPDYRKNYSQDAKKSKVDNGYKFSSNKKNDSTNKIPGAKNTERFNKNENREIKSRSNSDFRKNKYNQNKSRGQKKYNKFDNK